MVVQAAWPGATLDETRAPGHRADRAQAPGGRRPRLPAQLHPARASRRSSSTCAATPRRRRCRTAGTTCARRSATSATRCRSGVVGPGFNDDFGDVFGIIYGFTADGFTHRELRDYVEDARSRLLLVPDVSKIEIIGAQDEQIFLEFSSQRLAAPRPRLSGPGRGTRRRRTRSGRPASCRPATSGSRCGSRAPSIPSTTSWPSTSWSATA